MIIQVRGTSGSGKTWVMRQIMSRLAGMPMRKPVYKEGRKNPAWYEFQNGRVVVLGSYESVCGGCDNVGSAGKVYELIHEVDQRYTSVELDENSEEVLCTPAIVCEGLLLSEDVKWSSQLPDLHVLFLTTPIDTCLTQIKSRREEAGNNKPLNPENTKNRVRTINRARVKLTELGIDCRRCSARQAVDITMKLLGCTPTKGK